MDWGPDGHYGHRTLPAGLGGPGMDIMDTMDRMDPGPRMDKDEDPFALHRRP